MSFAQVIHRLWACFPQLCFALTAAHIAATPSMGLAMQDEPRELLRLRLPGAITRQAWITRYAAMDISRDQSEPVPAFAALRHSFERVAMHLDAIQLEDGGAGAWRDLLESALRNTRDAMDLYLWWDPRAFEGDASAWSALRLATRWIGVDPQLKQEILSAALKRGITDLDPDPHTVRLLSSAAGASAGTPCVGWNQNSELWMTLGAEALDLALAEHPAESVSNASEQPFLFQVDLSEWTAWFERGLFGREATIRTAPRKIAVEKQLRGRLATDRVRLPLEIASHAADSEPGLALELASGWLRVSSRSSLSAAHLTIASLLLRLQGEDESWVSAVRELWARNDSSDGQLAGLVCLPPSLLRLRLRPVLWFEGAGPSAGELERAGFRRDAAAWQREIAPGTHLYLIAGEKHWIASSDASDVVSIAAALHAALTRAMDADWVGTAEIETYELYSALWLGLLAQRHRLPLWMRSWVSGLPSPRECGALLSAARWDLSAESDGHLLIEGSGTLGDPAFSVFEMLLARAGLRALDLWLRDLAEPAYAKTTEAILAARATAVGQWWERHRDADFSSAAAAMSGELDWHSPMDPRWNGPPSLQLFAVAELTQSVRDALGLDPLSDSCPWVVLETEPWFEGGQSRYVAAWSRGSSRVLRTDFSPLAALSGR